MITKGHWPKGEMITILKSSFNFLFHVLFDQFLLTKPTHSLLILMNLYILFY